MTPEKTHETSDTGLIFLFGEGLKVESAIDPEDITAIVDHEEEGTKFGICQNQRRGGVR